MQLVEDLLGDQMTEETPDQLAFIESHELQENCHAFRTKAQNDVQEVKEIVELEFLPCVLYLSQDIFNQTLLGCHFTLIVKMREMSVKNQIFRIKVQVNIPNLGVLSFEIADGLQTSKLGRNDMFDDVKQLQGVFIEKGNDLDQEGLGLFVEFS